MANIITNKIQQFQKKCLHLIQYLAIIPLLKRNISKEIIMNNSTVKTENKTAQNTNILAQLKASQISQ